MVQLQYLCKGFEASRTIFLTTQNEILRTDYMVEKLCLWLCLLFNVCVGTDIHCVLFFRRHCSAFMCGRIYKELLRATWIATEASGEL